MKAEVASSTVLASSDGITLLDITHLLSGIVVFDGTNCTGIFDFLKTSTSHA